MFKKYKVLTSLLLISLLLSGCGSSSYKTESIAYDSATTTVNDTYSMGATLQTVNSSSMKAETVSEDYFEEAEMDNGILEESKIEEPIEVSTNRKLIKTVNLSMQTKQFDTFINKIEKVVEDYDGYIESSNVDGKNYYYDNNNRYANYTIRIPSKNLDTFLNNMNDLGTVSFKSENVEDVTLNYYDTEAQKDALEVEQERLMDILAEAETIEQIIALEQRLSEVRYEINSLGSTLRFLDNKVDYATIYLDLNEVEVEVSPKEEKTIIDTIKENWEINFVNIKYFFEDLVINLTSNLFIIIIEVVVVITIILIIRKRKKRKSKKEKNKSEEIKE